MVDRNETIFSVLGNTNVEQASRQVHVEPGEIENLSLPHSGVYRHRNDSLCQKASGPRLPKNFQRHHVEDSEFIDTSRMIESELRCYASTAVFSVGIES